jgi:peptide deformylase
MAIRNILQSEDPALLKISRIVTDFDRRLHILLDDMRETLIEANGLGLASPQVGVLRRAILVVDTNIEAEGLKEQIVEMINPEIVEKTGEQTGNEGCLSVPGVYGIVTRPECVKVKAQDRYGSNIELCFVKLAARALCHEIDHLNGIIFTTLADRFLTEQELEQLGSEKEGVG